MGRIAFPKPSIVIPTKPRIAELANTSATTGTYYTLADIIMGRGALYRVGLYSSNTGYFTAKDLVRITIDGQSTILSSNSGPYIRVSMQQSCVFNLQSFFKDHCKVEIKAPHTRFEAWLDYSLE